MLEDIKELLGITDTSKDSLLTLLIEQATKEAIGYTRNIETELEYAIIEMVIYNYNRRGTEGLSAEDYSGVSFTYITDYPDNIVRFLKSKRVLIVK